MVDTIGRCDCINSSDKFDITRLIIAQINRTSNSITRLEVSTKELKEFGANPEELIRRYELRKTGLSNLLEKVKNTPACK